MPGRLDCTERLNGRAGRKPGGDDALGRREARRMPRDDADEVVALERVELQVLECPHRRRPRHVAQQSDLAEEVAGPELARRRAVDVDLRPPGLDHVEAVAVLALDED